MPAGRGQENSSSNQSSRQTFRPPWVKDGPPPIPMPSQPWVKSNRNYSPAENKQETVPPFLKSIRRQPSTETYISNVPASTKEKKGKSELGLSPSPKENGTSLSTGPPKLPNKSATHEPQKKRVEVLHNTQLPTDKASDVVIPTKGENSLSKIPENQTKSNHKFEMKPQHNSRNLGFPEPPASYSPPAPPAPPPPPPPVLSEEHLVKQILSPEKKQRLEMLRSRPKKRPDWGNMMKEIETGKKLNHVKCNDRSAPLLPKVKAKGQFVYESERPNLHNQLLKQIETGIKLKPTKTNDRSKPFIEGLRKFRRQMTIEEQIQKSTSMASLGVGEVEPDPLDEVDDIDKVRDDLQSTKQLLAMELKNKETLERENKKLLTKILNLEVELNKEKLKANKEIPFERSEMYKEIDILKEEAKRAKEVAEETEMKYHEINAQYEILKLDLDESIQKNQRLEKQLKVAQAANLANLSQASPLTKQSSKKIIHQNKVHETIVAPDSQEESEIEEEETETETETESDNNGDDEEMQKERRLIRELKLLSTKLESCKRKEEIAKKERKNLKEQMKKMQKAIKEEKKNFKVLQKEVDKMSKLMNEEDDEDYNDDDDDNEDNDKDLCEDKDITEDESSEEDEETGETESEESEGDLPANSTPEEKKNNLLGRTKKHENLLSSLKKGNYLLKANVDRYKDEWNKQKEMVLTLQEDLNSVLAELG